MTTEKNGILEWIKAILIALVLCFTIRTFFVTPVIVDGTSMDPTLHNQDRMFVTKIGKIKRFDIVVFHATTDDDYIKRVIGLPGDRIEYKDDKLYINGKPYDEPYLDKFKKEITDGGYLTNSFTLKDTPVGGDVVPKGHLFVMGDNRRVSKDSRMIGAVPMNKVIGKTNLVYYPITDMKIVKN